jgi:hypothetical protein
MIVFSGDAVVIKEAIFTNEVIVLRSTGGSIQSSVEDSLLVSDEASAIRAGIARILPTERDLRGVDTLVMIIHQILCECETHLEGNKGER